MFLLFFTRRRLWIALFAFFIAAVTVQMGLEKVASTLADFALTIPPSAHSGWTPAMSGLGYETREAVASDGVHLKGWLIPADEKDRAVPLPTVVVIHGLGAGKEFMVHYILLAHREGHPVLAIDLRGHGESDPGPTTLGYREPLDVVAWLGLLQAEGVRSAVLWGTSLGAVTAIRGAAAAEKEGSLARIRVAGVIADAPFDTLDHTLENHARLFFGLPYFPLVPLTDWEIGKRFGVATKEIDVTAAARGLRAPLLVLAAEKDNRMPLPQVKAIYEAAPGPKAFYLIPGETHETRRFAPGFREVVTAFLRRCSTPETAPVPAER